jgi:hypothetical protein
MVYSAARLTNVLSMGDVNRDDRDDLAVVLQAVSSRLTANAAKDDGSPTQLFLHFDEFDLDEPSVRKYFTDLPTVLDRYYAVWQHALMPILETPNLHLIVTGRPLELSRVGTLHDGRSPCEGVHVVLGSLKEEHLVQVGKHTSRCCMRLACWRCHVAWPVQLEVGLVVEPRPSPFPTVPLPLPLSDC